jgi:hypothetical protein
MQRVFVMDQELGVNEALDIAMIRPDQPFMIRLTKDSKREMDLFGWRGMFRDCLRCKKVSAEHHAGVCTRCDPKSFLDQQLSLRGTGLMNDPLREEGVTFKWSL